MWGHESNVKFVEQGLKFGQFVALHLLNALVSVDRCVCDNVRGRERERDRGRESACVCARI